MFCHLISSSFSKVLIWVILCFVFLRLHNSLYYVDKTQNFLQGLLVFFYHFRIDRGIKNRKNIKPLSFYKKNKYKLTLTTLFILFCILPKLKFLGEKLIVYFRDNVRGRFSTLIL